MPLPNGLIPDVCQFCPDTGALFIGDAKHSEAPTNPYSLYRLRRYFWWLRRLKPSEAPDLFAICHAAGDGPA